MTSPNLVEIRVRNVLLDCLHNRANPAFASAFRKVIYSFAGRQDPMPHGAWKYEKEYLLPNKGRIDLLATSGKYALICEVKIDNREHLHQYLAYPRFLRAESLEVCCVGILRTKGRKNTGGKVNRKTLLDELAERAADARITWGDLCAELGKALGKDEDLLRFAALLRLTDPKLLNVTGRSGKNIEGTSTKNLADFAQSSATVIDFLTEFVERLGPNFESVPSQAGNSPIGLEVGLESWGKWFGDGQSTRLKLVYDIDAADRVGEPHFRFTVILGSSRSMGLDLARLRIAADHFYKAGYQLQRNVPGKDHSHQPWASPFSVDAKGLLKANAFDEPRFSLIVRQATFMGWEEALNLLVGEARRVIADIEALIAND